MPETNQPDQQDQIPAVIPITTFKFNPLLASSEKTQIQQEIQTIEERVSKIVARVVVGNFQMLASILQITHDSAELKLLARGIAGVVPLIERLDNLEEKLDTIEFIENNLPYLASIYGDFEEDLDKLDTIPNQDWNI